MKTVACIGLGNVGIKLAAHSIQCGLHIRALIDSTPSAHRELADSLSCNVLSSSVREIPSNTDVILICVQDTSVADVVNTLVDQPFSPKTLVAHTSGLLTSDVFDPLQPRLPLCGSIHPIQSFSNQMTPAALEGISCGIEGNAAFITQAKKLCALLSWNPIEIRKEMKPLYHTACVLAGNFSTVLLSDAARMLQQSATQPTYTHTTVDALMPMISEVLQRLRSDEFENTITGPAARQDEHAMNAHLKALLDHYPEFVSAYQILSERIQSLLERRKDH